MDSVPLRDEAAPLPLHVAVIMDGNGRWARARGLPRTAGHRRGASAIKVAIEAASRHGVGYLTLFGFSSENWKRPVDEVNDLVGLLRYYLEHEIHYLNKQGVRLRIIGDRRRFGEDIADLIDRAERATIGNRKLCLVIALSYGGRSEIVEATRAIADAAAKGTLAPADVDEQMISRHLFTRDIPDPDLLIRTSGEKRVSNFLLWQLAYAELVFIDTLWPDFSEAAFANAIKEFQGRERRYGAACV